MSSQDERIRIRVRVRARVRVVGTSPGWTRADTNTTGLLPAAGTLGGRSVALPAVRFRSKVMLSVMASVSVCSVL